MSRIHPHITLTHIERANLDSSVNLADGHVRRQPTPTEAKIVGSLQDVYNLSLRHDPIDLENKFVSSFLGLSGQAVPNTSRFFVFFSASEAISVAGRVLGMHQETCAVLEPTFDNIPALIGAAGVEVSSFKEGLLRKPAELLKKIGDKRVVCVTMPNNPTSNFLSEQEFKRLCAACAEAGKSIIIDATFRLYEPSVCYDYYAILAESNLDWMVIEDTGKFWAANDLKAGVLVTSPKYSEAAGDNFHDLVLSISPFNLALLWQLAEKAADAVTEIRNVIKDNRKLVRTRLSGHKIFRPDDRDVHLSVELVYYDEARFPDQAQLVTRLHELGLGVTGSEGYYWAKGQHKRFIRLALARDKIAIKKGLDILESLAS